MSPLTLPEPLLCAKKRVEKFAVSIRRSSVVSDRPENSLLHHSGPGVQHLQVLPCFPVYDRRMAVLKNGPLLDGVSTLCLTLYRFAVNQTAGVLPIFKDINDGVHRPLAPIAGVVAAGAARPVVFQRSRHRFALGQHTGKLNRAVPDKAMMYICLTTGVVCSSMMEFSSSSIRQPYTGLLVISFSLMMLFARFTALIFFAPIFRYLFLPLFLKKAFIR